MSFTIVRNDEHLEIEWSDDTNATPFNIQQLQDSYSYIGIKGQDYNEFIYYNIFSRTQSVEISNCTINLSKIVGRIEYISIANCKCINDFLNDCSTSRLSMVETSIQIQQLLNLKIEQFHYEYSSTDQTDFYNCDQLKCKLNSLTLSKQNVNLSLLKGKWHAIQFDYCSLSGCVDNKQLNVARVDVKMAKHNYKNSFECLTSLQCEEFFVSIYEQNDSQDFELGYMTNEFQQKQKMHAYLENQTCDLSSVQDIWSSLRFSNCVLRGTTCKFKNTMIELSADEYCKAIDFSPFYNTKAALHIHLKNVQVDLAQVRLCNPKELSMRCCIIELSQLVGNWQTLTLNESCDFIQPSGQTILPGSIHAEKLALSDVSNQICSYFSASVFELGRTTNEINSLPNAHELLLVRSTINLTHFNHQVKELQLYNAKLRKFSVLYTPELQKIDLNCINDRDAQNATKQAIINFLRQKKKHKNVLKQKLNRIIYEEKRNLAVRKRLQILQENLEVLDERVQILGGIE
ncbi:Hypothetical_protein [Hexamita inflata]|uniref:Hypothetical_protein n=1 Tax=Hexamita inflata TaxID=28002 RepID=A0AA86TGV9_9EUKA|nr:Hypothetical protein HINF_LOCUS3407 [Hexamita inflata]